jgi:preprotein translocase subunit SecB
VLATFETTASAEDIMTNATNGGEAAAAPPEGPSLSVITQYIKDFSFENPNAPNSLLQQQQPQIGIQINVNPRQMSATDFEVELKLEGKAELIGSILFAFDLNYAGVFRLVNIPQENLGPLLMIECPRLLFPFAREIISNAIASGGFPPLMLHPIDFVGLYQRRIAEMQATQQPTQVG